MSTKTLDIKLMGKDYRVSCKPGERDSLMTAVDYLDGKLSEIAEKTRSTGERLAVMAALNLAHELLTTKNPLAMVGASLDSQAIQGRIKAIESKLDESLARYDALALK
ncbi:MAG TPA: cell division protein ZapA [Rhodocyclaceae bacterium]|nr:cell division protein ZapA [Rhodocyclaceae bacterium]